MLKIALVGAGEHSAAAHGPALARYASEHPDQVALAAVCDLQEERAQLFCRNFGFARAYTRLDHMLDEEKPDACWVVVPIQATRELVAHVMERRVAVLFEKPPGKSLGDARELAEISRRTGTPNMVAFNRRFAPCTQKALAWTRDHGLFEYLHARMLRAGRRDERFAFDTGIHLLDCVRALAEAGADHLTSARTTRIQAASGVFNFHVDIAFRSGASARCDLLPTCGVVEETYTLFGRDRLIAFSLPWHTVDGRADLWVEGKLVASETWPAPPAFLYGGFYGECEAFITALKEGRQPSPSVAEALASVALAEAVQEGRQISFP